MKLLSIGDQEDPPTGHVSFFTVSMQKRTTEYESVIKLSGKTTSKPVLIYDCGNYHAT